MNLLEQPYWLIVLLSAFSLVPLWIVMGSAFLKIAITLSLLRNAVGIQQVPPNMAIYGLSLLLTLFIMAPIGVEIYDSLQLNPLVFDSPQLIQRLDQQIIVPYRKFLVRHAAEEQIDFFTHISQQIWPETYQKRIASHSLLVLLPAFMVSQLIEAFKIGLLLYLPFIAIDLIVSNVLLAMGMMMVSPMTIALPFKLLIFILAGGWQKLINQLVLSFA